MRLFLEALADKESVNSDGNPVLTQIDNSFYTKLMRFLSNVVTIIKTPSVLCTQMQKQIDINRIHPEKLSGNKVSFYELKFDLILSKKNLKLFKPWTPVVF